MNLKEVLKSHRETLSLSIEDMAEIVGVDTSTYASFERGEVVPNKEQVITIFRALCIEENDFVDHSSKYDLSDVSEDDLKITKEIINSIESGDFDA